MLIRHLQRLFILSFVLILLLVGWIVYSIQTIGCCSNSGPNHIVKFMEVGYEDLMCVKMSEDGSQLTAFADPSNVISQSPIPLKDDYYQLRMACNTLLDITIEEYSRLGDIDSESFFQRMQELTTTEMIPDPFSEEYECCRQCIHSESDLNAFIAQGQLSSCISLK